jgi:hypothetical protein
MAVVHFVVAVRSDEEQVLDSGVCQEPVQEVERRRVDPLQVVQKYDQRMLSLCERADETLEDITESIPSLRWVQGRWRRLFCR